MGQNKSKTARDKESILDPPFIHTSEPLLRRDDEGGLAERPGGIQWTEPLLLGDDEGLAERLGALEPDARLTAVEAMLASGREGRASDGILVEAVFTCLGIAPAPTKRVTRMLARLADQSEEPLRIFAERIVGEPQFETPLRVLIEFRGRAYPWLRHVAAADRRPEVRRFLLDRLWEVTSDDLAPIHCAILEDDEHEEVRRAALGGLLRCLELPGISRALIQITTSPDFESEAVRFAAATQVLRVNPMDAIPALALIARTDSDEGRRASAATALESLGTGSEEKAIREAATGALRSLVGAGPTAPGGPTQELELGTLPGIPAAASGAGARAPVPPTSSLSPLPAEVQAGIVAALETLKGIASKHSEAIPVIHEALRAIDAELGQPGAESCPASLEPSVAGPARNSPGNGRRRESRQVQEDDPTTRLPEVVHPLVEAMRRLWEARLGLPREQLTEQFQAVLDEAHKAESLGSYGANSALCKWVNTFARKFRYRLMLGDEAVTVGCEPRKTGYFKPRYGMRGAKPVPGAANYTFPRLQAYSLTTTGIRPTDG